MKTQPFPQIAALCLAATLAAAAAGPARAADITLKEGLEFEVCRDLAAEFAPLPDLPLFPYDRLFDPSRPDFRWVQWEALDPLADEEILRLFVIHRYEPRPKTKSPGQQAAEWQAWKPVLLREARAGQVVVERAVFDSNGDGAREPVYRIALKNTLTLMAGQDPAGWNNNWVFVVLPKDGPKASRQWTGRAGARPFYYKNQLYYLDALHGPEVQAPSDRADYIVLESRCKFETPPMSAAQYDKLEEEAVRAAERRSMGFVRSVLHDGGDADTIDISGFTLLENAIRYNYRKDVQALLERGADPARCGLTGRCPMYMAVDADVEILRLLLAAGADPNWQNKRTGESILASVAGQSFGRFLIFSGPGPHAIRYRQGPLPVPVEAARILIAAGADVNRTDPWGRTPLGEALRAGNQDVAQALVEAGAHVAEDPGENTRRTDP